MAPAARAQVQSWYLDVIREANAQATERSLSDRLAGRLGGALWSRCLHEWKPSTCRSLEHAARELEQLAENADESQLTDPPVELLGTPTWQRWLGVDLGGRALAARLARTILPPPFPDPVQAAATLRLYGVAVCMVSFGLLGFEYCACAEALAVTTPAASVAEELCALR